MTPGGEEVRSPNAYRRAWGKPQYIGSTLHVEVGRGWLIKRLMMLWAEKDRRRAKRQLRLKLATPNGVAHDYALVHGRPDLAVLFL